MHASLGSPTRSPNRPGAPKEAIASLTKATQALPQKEQPRDLWASVGAVVAGKAAEREDSDSSGDMDFDLFRKNSSAQLPREKSPQKEEARDLWENIATEIRSGKLKEDYDLQQAVEKETPSSRLAAKSKDADDTPGQRLAGVLGHSKAPARTEQLRDLWSNVASEIKSGALAEDYDLQRAAEMETPASRLAAKSKGDSPHARLASVLEGPVVSLERDLWSKVATEIKDATLAEDFNLSKAKAMETPSSRLAAQTEGQSPSKLLASALNIGFKVELLDDDTDSDLDAVKPKQASGNGLLLGERLRTHSSFMSSASQRARQATASAAASASAPLVRGSSASAGSAMAGAAPLRGLRLSGPSAGSSIASDAVSAKAQPKLPSWRRADPRQFEDSSDDDIFSAGTRSLGAVATRARAAAAARRTKLNSVAAVLNDSDDDDDDGIVLKANKPWSSVSHRGAQETKMNSPAAANFPKKAVGTGVARRAGSDSDTSDSDGAETAALAQRWATMNSPSGKAKARVGSVLDFDSD